MKRDPASDGRPTGPAAPPSADRRVMPRVAGSPPLAVSGLHATVHDVSRTGISLELYEPVEPGRRCRLVLVDQFDGSLQEIEAEAVWCRGSRAGFRWLGMTDEQEYWLGNRFRVWLANQSHSSSA